MICWISSDLSPSAPQEWGRGEDLPYELRGGKGSEFGGEAIGLLPDVGLQDRAIPGLQADERSI